MPKYYSFLALCCMAIVACFSSCDTNYIVHEYRDYPQHYWRYDAAAVFHFDIEDPSKTYDLFYRVRNDRSYPFYNLYVKYELLDAKGNVLRKQQHEMNLVHPKTGAPLGSGESIYDHEVLVVPDYKFEEAGSYQFRMQQYMRLDTLQGITAVGFSVQLAE